MPSQRPPSPPDLRPAHWVETLWSLWLDPVELAFEELAIQRELEELRARRGRQPAASADREPAP